jgi:tetratricopeptide (TPR) repeat protein
MVTKKKHLWKRICILAGLAVVTLLAGCGRSGPDALVEGARLMQEGKRESAMEKILEAIQLMPTNAQAWNYLGVCYHQQGDFTNAQYCYRSALKFNHYLNVVHYNLGCLFLDQNQPDALDAAQNELISFTTLEPHSPEGLLKLATVELRQGKLAQAESAFWAVYRMDPQNAEALNDLGMVQLQRRHYRDAMTDFNLAAGVRKDYGPALLNLAVTEIYLNNRQQALKYYQDYLALNPRPANWQEVNDAAQELVLELGTQSRPASSEDSARSTAGGNAQPKQPVALSNNSKPIIASNYKPDPAASDHGKNSPDVVQRAESRGLLQKLNPLKIFGHSDKNPQSQDQLPPGVPLTEQETTVVVAGSEETPKIKPRPRPGSLPAAHYPYLKTGAPPRGDAAGAQAFLAKGAEAQKNRNLKEAEAAYRSATEADPGDFDAQFDLASAAYEAGDIPTAMRAYELAQMIAPDSFKARYGFGLALKKGNYFADAARQLERLIDSSPADASPEQMAGAHLTLGNIYSDQFHDVASARKHYQKVLELDPHNSQETAVRYWLQSNP